MFSFSMTKTIFSNFRNRYSQLYHSSMNKKCIFIYKHNVHRYVHVPSCIFSVQYCFIFIIPHLPYFQQTRIVWHIRFPKRYKVPPELRLIQNKYTISLLPLLLDYLVYFGTMFSMCVVYCTTLCLCFK